MAWWAVGVLAAGALGAGADGREPSADEAVGRAQIETRLREACAWLAAADREGRGPGTAGIEQAADWVARQFEAVGLDTAVVDDVSFQRFPITLEATLGPASENTAEIVGPPGPDGTPTVRPLELGKDFTPLAAGGSGPFDLPLAFAGYGITAPKEGYDDYAPFGPSGAKGSAVIVLRQEPQKDDPHSVFDGNQASQYAALSRKVANASEHEAGGLVFCNDASDKEDALMVFERAGDGSEKRTMPVLHVRRAVLEPLLAEGLGRDLSSLERTIDEKLEPQAAALAGWRIRGRVTIARKEAESRNVLAVLPGTAGRETIVLGAHYDHLGFGGANSAAPGETAVHHGADDNASGTAMLVEVARILAAEGPFPRTILFAAFSGEERGLLGSAHYTANAAVPLSDTAAMVNLDMVGRLDGDKVIVHGTGTGTGLDAMVDRLVATHNFDVAKEPGGFGPSDHSSFYARRIPVLHLFTGSHPDYHRPTDTADKINYAGMVRLTRLVADLVKELEHGKNQQPV